MIKLNEASLRIDAVALLNVLKTAKRLGAFNIEFCSDEEIKRNYLHSNVISPPEDDQGECFGISPVFFLIEEMGLSFAIDVEENGKAYFVFIQFIDIEDLQKFYLEIFGIEENQFIEMIEF